MTTAGEKIIAGMEDALAFAKGDESKATLHPSKITAEQLHETARSAAAAYIQETTASASKMARALLPMVKQARDEGMAKEFAVPAVMVMIEMMDGAGAGVEQAIDEVMKEMELVD